MKASSLPWPSIAIVGFTSVGMLLGGIGAWLVAGVALLWLGSLWLSRPEPVFEPRRIEDGSVSRQAMVDLIEPFGLPVLMLDRERIAAANEAAREALGPHIVGQDARIALRHPEAVKLLDAPEAARATIRGLTGPRSIWQLSRAAIDERYSLIEMINRTAEADISRAHTDFVANASHELRTPLSSIIGYIETLSDETAKVDKATRTRFQATVLREAKRLQSLVEDLMSLSRIEAEKHDRPTERIDIVNLAASVTSDMAAMAGEARVRLEPPAHPVTVLGDRRQLDQLLRNLVDNGLKYGDPQQPVTVRVTEEGRNVLLAVEDRGEGIDADHLPHLTRRFYRTDPGRSRAAGGTGLGLAIVKHIVERHRGRLDITSERGIGTTIAVRLAVVENGAPAL